MRFKSAQPIFTFLLVFLTAGTIGIYIRLFPLRHYTSDTSWDKASLLVVNNAVNAIRNKINDSSTTLLSEQKQIQLAKTKLNEVMSTEKKELKDAIYRVAKKIDQEVAPRYPFPYLLASDSYYYYALTQKIAQTGRLSPEIKGSKYFYPEMSAPTGYWEPLTLHPYVGFAVYKIAQLFNPNIPLMFAVSFTPLVMTLLILLVFLALAQNQRCSGWAMLIAGVYLLCARIFLKRSAFAWYDNDSYSVFFPMLLMLILSFAFCAENRGKKIYCGILAAITLSLYTMFWQGWMFVATVLAASGALLIILERLMKKPSAERSTRFWAVFGLCALACISVIFGVKEIFVLFQEGWQALLGFMNAKLSVWPETYVAVGELKKLSLSANVGLTGGWFALAISLFGLISRTRQMFVEKNIVRHRLFIVTVIFAAAASVISIGAQRFTLLCVTPFSILFLFGVHDLLELITGLTAKIPQLRQPLIQKVGIPVAICLALIIPKAVHSENTMV
ncbi:MAG TPA: STT3 domain-containing protein, partial [Candidatus Bathyarchaeia archaeon]|nr:STT3 domain-containing protein [Candidatus Bathyarchaeia archaeon]